MVKGVIAEKTIRAGFNTLWDKGREIKTSQGMKL